MHATVDAGTVFFMPFGWIAAERANSLNQGARIGIVACSSDGVESLTQMKALKEQFKKDTSVLTAFSTEVEAQLKK